MLDKLMCARGEEKKNKTGKIETTPKKKKRGKKITHTRGQTLFTLAVKMLHTQV